MKRVRLFRHQGFLVSLLLSLFVLSSGTAWAIQSIKMNLEKMAKQAGRIVEGTVLSVSEGSVPSPGGRSIPVMEYTFSVSQSLKGKADATVVVRQIKLPGVSSIMASGSGSGLPAYKVGEHLILFLTHESVLGLSSPVGLMQGVFQVQKDKEGRKEGVINGTNNAGLFDGMMHKKSRRPAKMKSNGVSSQEEGLISYSQFISDVKNMVGSQ